VVTATPNPNQPSATPVIQTVLATQLVTQIVTATPLPATETPASTATPETTPPGTILNIGQTWRQGGAELKLRDVAFRPDRVTAYFEFTSRNSLPISMDVTTESNMLAFDNKKQQLKVCLNTFEFGCPKAEYVVNPEQTINMRDVTVFVDTGDRSITEVILKVVNVSSITEGQWRIPINH